MDRKSKSEWKGYPHKRQSLIAPTLLTTAVTRQRKVKNKLLLSEDKVKL